MPKRSKLYSLILLSGDTGFRTLGDTDARDSFEGEEVMVRFVGDGAGTGVGGDDSGVLCDGGMVVVRFPASVGQTVSPSVGDAD